MVEVCLLVGGRVARGLKTAVYTNVMLLYGYELDHHVCWWVLGDD